VSTSPLSSCHPLRRTWDPAQEGSRAGRPEPPLTGGTHWDGWGPYHVRRTEVAEACQWARRRGDKDRRRGLGFESSQVRKDGRAMGGARSEPNRAMRRRRISSANTHGGMGRNLPHAAADGDLGLGVAHLARQPPPLLPSFLLPPTQPVLWGEAR
jgi:hypothetical protein